VPTYEYKCDACGHRFERQQKMSDPPVNKCPECGQPVRRLISAVAGIVRGASVPCADKAPACGRDASCDKRTCELLER